MPANNIKVDSKDLARAATALQTPNLVQAAGHEVRSTLWLFVIFGGLFGAVGLLVRLYSAPAPSGPSRQEIQDYLTTQKNLCVAQLVAQGYSSYSDNNCSHIASVTTYNRYGRLP